MDTSSLFLDTGHLQHVVCVHPLAVASILDHFSRRRAKQTRVVGTLLGTSTEGSVEVTDAFAVPLSDADDVDVATVRTVAELRRRTAPNEAIVGWYSTGTEITESSSRIHELFWKEIRAPPVLLTVGCALSNDRLPIRAYVCSSLRFGDKTLGAYFHPVQCHTRGSDMERVAASSLVAASSPSEGDSVEPSVRKLLELLDAAIAYTRAAQAGTVKGDAAIGQELTEVVQSLPALDRAQLDSAFTDGLQDLLMASYLANMTRSQLGLSERLRQALVTAPAPAAAPAAAAAAPAPAAAAQAAQ
eukprot:m51a1_g6644 putative eukaryotic translation initiation factor 3 subunit f-like (301) ;mRNA; f:115422-116468